MKFEFTPDQGSSPEPNPDQEGVLDVPHPTVRIAAAAEQMHTRARFDFHRLNTALNRMQYTVQTTQVLEPDPVMDLEA
ncbi:hypothetical protein, partial [Nocardiopsis sp. B62]|uniref:hypothetical protein n=1 Tax=Nocardiopsis sp. B62 TaxID=2824874 RepID=UPI001B6D6104|nr:hypothetical protein [Nocardiopsis sp. B62]